MSDRRESKPPPHQLLPQFPDLSGRVIERDSGGHAQPGGPALRGGSRSARRHGSALVIEPPDPAAAERRPGPAVHGAIESHVPGAVVVAHPGPEHAPSLGSIRPRIQPEHVRPVPREVEEQRDRVDRVVEASQIEGEKARHPLSVGLSESRILVCVDDFLLWILDAVQAVDPIARTLIAGVAVMLETSILIGLIVPGDTIVIIASMGVEGPLEAIAMVVSVVIGALIGESIGFWLGRWLGPRIRSSWIGRRIGDRHWQQAENYLQRRGGLAIFLSRFLPVLHSLVPLTVGMSHYSYRRFLAWTAPACLLWAAAYVSVTSLAAGGFRELVDRVHFAGYIFVGVIVVFLLLVLIGKKLLTRWEARHMRARDDDAPRGMKD